MDARTAVMQYMCPSLGAALAFFMFISPMRAVLRVNRTKQLGELNALPYAFMASNGLGWIVYGLVIHDYFVYGSNISGLLLGLFYVMTCYKYSSEKSQDLMSNILLAVCTLFLAMGLVHMAAGLDAAGKKTLWGVVAAAIIAAYYITPLSTLAKVFRLRDSSSLQRPLLVANMCNGTLWFCYGIAIGDWFLIVPNGIGAIFGLISLLISFLIPRSSSSSSSSGGGGGCQRGSSSSSIGKGKNAYSAAGADLLPVADSRQPKTAVAAAAAAAAAAGAGRSGTREYDAVCLTQGDQGTQK